MNTSKIFNENRLIFESLETPKDKPQTSPEKGLQLSLDGLKENLPSADEVKLAQSIVDSLKKIPELANENINTADIFMALHFALGKFDVKLSTQEEQKSSKILKYLYKAINGGHIKGVRLVFLGGTDSTRHLARNKSEMWHTAKKDAFNKLIELAKNNRIAPPGIQATLTDTATVSLINEYISSSDPNKFMKDHSKDFLPGGGLFDIALAFQRAEQLKNNLNFEDKESEVNGKDFIYLDINKSNKGRPYRKASIRLITNNDKLETSSDITDVSIPVNQLSENITASEPDTNTTEPVDDNELPDDTDPDVTGNNPKTDGAITSTDEPENESDNNQAIPDKDSDAPSYTVVPIPRLSQNTPDSARQTAKDLIGTNSDEAKAAMEDYKPDETLTNKPKTENVIPQQVTFTTDDAEQEADDDKEEGKGEEGKEEVNEFDDAQRAAYMEHVTKALGDLNFDTNTWDFDDDDDIQALAEFIVNECQRLGLDPLEIDIKNIPELLVDGEVVFDVDEKVPNMTGADALFSEKNVPVLSAITKHLESLNEVAKKAPKKKHKAKKSSKPIDDPDDPDEELDKIIGKFDNTKRAAYIERFSKALGDLNFDTNTWDFDDDDDIQVLAEFIVNECQRLELDPEKVDIKNIPELLVDGEVVFDADEKVPNQTGSDALFSKKNEPVLSAITTYLESLNEALLNKI